MKRSTCGCLTIVGRRASNQILPVSSRPSCLKSLRDAVTGTAFVGERGKGSRINLTKHRHGIDTAAVRDSRVQPQAVFGGFLLIGAEVDERSHRLGTIPGFYELDNKRTTGELFYVCR